MRTEFLRDVCMQCKRTFIYYDFAFFFKNNLKGSKKKKKKKAKTKNKKQTNKKSLKT